MTQLILLEWNRLLQDLTDQNVDPDKTALTVYYGVGKFREPCYVVGNRTYTLEKSDDINPHAHNRFLKTVATVEGLEKSEVKDYVRNLSVGALREICHQQDIRINAPVKRMEQINTLRLANLQSVLRQDHYAPFIQKLDA